MVRHPGITALLGWLQPNPKLPSGTPADIAATVASLAADIVNMIPVDDPELTAGLRKLLEAKDCFVRAAIAAQRETP